MVLEHTCHSLSIPFPWLPQDMENTATVPSTQPRQRPRLLMMFILPTSSLLLIQTGERVALGDSWKQQSPLSRLLLLIMNPGRGVRLLCCMALSSMWGFQLLFVPSWVLVTHSGVTGLHVTSVPFLRHVDSYPY